MQKLSHLQIIYDESVFENFQNSQGLKRKPNQSVENQSKISKTAIG